MVDFEYIQKIHFALAALHFRLKIDVRALSLQIGHFLFKTSLLLSNSKLYRKAGIVRKNGENILDLLIYLICDI